MGTWDKAWKEESTRPRKLHLVRESGQETQEHGQSIHHPLAPPTSTITASLGLVLNRDAPGRVHNNNNIYYYYYYYNNYYCNCNHTATIYLTLHATKEASPDSIATLSQSIADTTSTRRRHNIEYHSLPSTTQHQ